MPAIAPSYIFATLANEFYRTGRRIRAGRSPTRCARSTARSSTRASSLQIDDPRLVTYYMMNPGAQRGGLPEVGGEARRGDQLLAARHPARQGALPHLLQHRRRAPRLRHGAEGHRRHPAARSTPARSRSRRRIRGTSTSTTCSSRSGRRTGRSSSRASSATRRTCVEHPELIAERIVRLREDRRPRERHRRRRLRIRRLRHPVQRHPPERRVAEVRRRWRRARVSPRRQLWGFA